jgi:hypothetical protein
VLLRKFTVLVNPFESTVYPVSFSVDRTWTEKRLRALIFAFHTIHNSSTVGLVEKTGARKTQRTLETPARRAAAAT